MKIAGSDFKFRYDSQTLNFDITFSHSDAATSNETIIFLPSLLYSIGKTDIETSDGLATYDSKVIFSSK